ncbi:hypothetical protein [Actinomadura sp. SCN-SB]|uniref:hypothetical protein n=1 Tax=Actinomadura sp. SCN-SB TaxID=3373092 RepID=UPI00375116DD
MGRHSRRGLPADVFPSETRPDGTFLPSWIPTPEESEDPDWAERAHEEREEVFDSFWEVAEDFAENGKVDKPHVERLVRALRTLAQGAIAAVVVSVIPAVSDVVQGGQADGASLVNAAKVAAVSALAAYLMPKSKK